MKMTPRTIEAWRLCLTHEPQPELGQFNWPMVLEAVLDEMERLRVRLAAVEALLPGTDKEFPIFPFQVREALGSEPGDFLLIPPAALAEGSREQPTWCEHGQQRPHEYTMGGRLPKLRCPGPTDDERPSTQCAGRLGSKPDWMSDGQYDACRCKLATGHDGDHQCEHTRASLADAFVSSRDHDAAPPLTDDERPATEAPTCTRPGGGCVCAPFAPGMCRWYRVAAASPTEPPADDPKGQR